MIYLLGTIKKKKISLFQSILWDNSEPTEEFNKFTIFVKF